MDTPYQQPVIRLEEPPDISAISAVISAAFGSNDEVALVLKIRGRGQSLLSLVATIENRIIGHVMASPITINASPDSRYAGIAPLSVAPDYQKTGVGSLLMKSVIQESMAMGIEALFLLGSPGYYPRFGFTKSHINNEYQATDAFMHLELQNGSLVSVTGLAEYVSAFRDVGV